MTEGLIYQVSGEIPSRSRPIRGFQVTVSYTNWSMVSSYQMFTYLDLHTGDHFQTQSQQIHLRSTSSHSNMNPHQDSDMFQTITLWQLNSSLWKPWTIKIDVLPIYIKMVMFNSCFVCLPGRVIPKHHHYFQPLGGKETQLADCINFRVRVPGRFFFSHLRCKWIVPPIWWIFDFFYPIHVVWDNWDVRIFPLVSFQHPEMEHNINICLIFPALPWVSWTFPMFNGHSRT